MSDSFRIPQSVIRDMDNRANPEDDWIKLPIKLFMFDGFKKDTQQGYKSREEFVGEALKGDKGAIFEITLWPSIEIPSKDSSIDAMYLQNITNYNQPDNDIVRLIYSQERPSFLIKQELNVKDKFILFTTESPYFEEGETTTKISSDVFVYTLKSYEPAYDRNGKFFNAKITLERLVSFVSARRKSDGTTTFDEYDQFNFYTAPIQPLNVIRRRITFKSKPIVWQVIHKNKNQQVIPNKRVDNSFWNEDCFLPIRTDSRVSFSPVWSIENAFWNNMTNADTLIGFVRNSGIVGYTLNKLKPRYTDGFIELGFGKISNAGYYGFPASENFSRTTLNVRPPDFPNYYEEFLTTTYIAGGKPSVDELTTFFYSYAKDIFNFALPFSSTGLKNIITDIGQISSTTLPRGIEQRNALWNTYKSEALLFVDFGFFFADLYVGSGYNVYTHLIRSKTYNDNASKSTLYKVKDSFANDYKPYIKSQKRKDNIDKLLNGNLTWLGETISTRPDDLITKSFDFSPHPIEWNKEEMKKYLGIFPAVDSFFENYPLQIDHSELYNLLIEQGKEGTPAIDVYESLIEKASKLFFRYVNANNLKGYQMKHDFYLNENEEYVLEFEFNENTNLTTAEYKIFGGYEWKIEDFQNTKADAEIHGDKPCEYTSHKGTKLPLPPQYYKAPNLQGQPNKAYLKIIYGTGK